MLVRGTASENRIIGVRFDNSKHNKGFAFYQNVGTGVGNQMLGNSYGAVGTAVLAAPVPGDLATALTGPLRPATPAGYMQSGALYQGTGIPRDTDGSDGDVYFRTDTPGVATQRMYVKSGGNWVGIL